MTSSSLDDLMLRIPDVVAASIFVHLNVRDLRSCIKVCTGWNAFVNTNLLANNPDLKHKLEEEDMVSRYTNSNNSNNGSNNRFREVRLDCELEMRVEDWHRIRSVHVDEASSNNMVYAQLVVAQKHEEDRRDYFVFRFDGHTGRPDPEHHIRLSQMATTISFFSTYILVELASDCYGCQFQIFRKIDLARVTVSAPESHAVMGAFAAADTMYLLVAEKPGDEFMVLTEVGEETEEEGETRLKFAERCLVEFPYWKCNRCVMEKSGKYLAICPADGTTVALHDLVTGEELWRRDFLHFDVVLHMVRSDHLTVILKPKAENENALVRVCSVADGGNDLVDFEVPDNLMFVQVTASEDLFAISYPEYCGGDGGNVASNSVLEVYDFNKNRKERIVVDVIVNSLEVISSRLLAVTLSRSELCGTSLGQLAFVDLENMGNMGNDKFGEVKLFHVGPAAAAKGLFKVGKDGFVCHRNRHDNSNALSLVHM